MKSTLYTTLVILASAALGSVMERSSNYSCCENLTIEFDQNCAATFSINNKTIAESDGNGCVTPCKKIEAGRMTLDQCVDLKMVLVCTEELIITEEKRIDLHVQPCSGSNNNAAGNQGSVGSLLLVLGIAWMFAIC